MNEDERKQTEMRVMLLEDSQSSQGEQDIDIRVVRKTGLSLRWRKTKGINIMKRPPSMAGSERGEEEARPREETSPDAFRYR